MDKIILTPRLKLTLVQTAEDGSAELASAHVVQSSPEASIWRYVCEDSESYLDLIYLM